MNTRYLNIEEKHRRFPGFIASMKDFTVSDGEVVDSQIILDNQNLSLYCFDDDQNRAIFVELPPDVDLTQVPFVYTTQYEEAQRLVAVPYDEFRNIAHSLPPVEHLIMVYISGRSGSTLLSHIFNEVDGVMSLSEPDVITQFVHLREDHPEREAELRELADCTVRLLFKPNPYKRPKTYVLKFRLETLRAMDFFQTTFPDAKNLYLYREVAGFVRSFYRIIKENNLPESQPFSDYLAFQSEVMHYDFTPKTIYLDPDIEQVSRIQELTLWWMVGVEWYLEQANKGIGILPVRYKDFKASREKVLEAIFEHCNLPVERASQPFRAFERDSQAGTVLARGDNALQGNQLQLTDEQVDEMKRILERHPIINRLDYVVPNTLQV